MESSNHVWKEGFLFLFLFFSYVTGGIKAGKQTDTYQTVHCGSEGLSVWFWPEAQALTWRLLGAGSQ